MAIFLALGVVPTLAVAAWGLWWRSAWHAGGEAQRLGWQLGLNASLAAVRHPRPGVVVYEGLELREPETNQPVFRSKSVEIRRGRRTEAGAGPQDAVHLILVQPEINAAQWGEIWGLVDRVLSRRVGLGDVPLEVAAGQLTLVAGPQRQCLVEIDGQVETLPGRTGAAVAFRVAGQPMPRPARLKVIRNRQLTPPATGFELDTGGTPLPCAVLAIGLEGFGLAGPRGQFCGTVWAIQTRDGPSGELAGQLTDVELDHLVRNHPPHQLSGTADVSVQRARFSRGQLQEAAGSVVAGPGLVSRSLLEIAVARLGLAGGAQTDQGDPLVPYEQLALWFACDGKGLRVRGLSQGATEGTILAGRRGPILAEPPSPAQPLPVELLVRVLTPAADALAPVARQQDPPRPRPALPQSGSPTGDANPLR